MRASSVCIFFNQKTAYEIYQCDWSSDVCSSDLGVLPENLPPPFTSRGLWELYEPLGDAYLVVKKCVGAHSTYDASKRGRQRRVFSLPHPTFVREGALFFDKHWADLSALLEAPR